MIIALTSTQTEGFGEIFSSGMLTTLVGIVMVLLILVLLMLVLILFKKFFANQPAEKTAKETLNIPQKITVQSEDEQIPAVIAAAVAAYMENASPQTKYRIRSFKRI